MLEMNTDMDPNGNLFLRVQQKIKDGEKGDDDDDGTQKFTPSGVSQQSREKTRPTKPAEEIQGTSRGNDSVIIIPDTPSPVFSRFVGKRGKQGGGKLAHKFSDRCVETSTCDDYRESDGSSHRRLPGEPMLTPEKQSSPWKQNLLEGKNNKESVSSPKIMSSFRSKFLDAKGKMALSPGKVKISPYVPSHGIHFKTALQEMMARKQDRSRNESNHPIHNQEQSARKVSHSASGLPRKPHDPSHLTEPYNHVDNSSAKLSHRHHHHDPSSLTEPYNHVDKSSAKLSHRHHHHDPSSLTEPYNHVDKSSAKLSHRHHHHDPSSVTEPCNHVDKSSSRFGQRHSVKPSHKLPIEQSKRPDKETLHSSEAACNVGRRKSEASSSPTKSKRARLDAGFHTKELYPTHGTWPSESSDSDDSDFDSISSQTLKAMIDQSCTSQTDSTLPAAPVLNVTPGDWQVHLHRLRDGAKEHANHAVAKHAHPKPHFTHVSSLHDITTSRSSNHNPQGLQMDSDSSHRQEEQLDGNHTKNVHTKQTKSDQREKMSDWFDDGFSRMTESDWSPMVREESRSHSRKMAAERSRSIQLAALEARANKNKTTYPSPGTERSYAPVLKQDGSPSRPIVCENVTESTTSQSLMDQVEGDEELAKKLQEQMDMEFAMSLQNLENQPPVFGAGVFPHHRDMSMPSPVLAYNRGPMAVGQGRWATAQRGRVSSRYPDLDEVEALLHDLDEPEERLLQHSPQGRPMTRNGVRTQTGQHFLDDIAHLNNSLLSMLEGGGPVFSPPVVRHPRSRRRGQRRNAAPRGFDVGSPVDGNDYEDLLSLAEMLGDVKNKGLTEAQSSRLPVRTYQSNSEKQDAEECLICMCEYDQDDRLKMLPCFHEFHAQCIDKWIKGNASCPVCRVEVKLA